MGHGADWQPVADALASTYRCLSPDLPGHGGSKHLDDDAYTMEGAAAAVLGVLDDAGVAAATLVGYSMGGRLALHLALNHPERVTALVLESATPGIEGEMDRAERRRLDATRAEAIAADYDAFLAQWYRQRLFFSLRVHGLVEAMVARRREHNDPAELGRVLRGMGTGEQPSLWGALVTLAPPTLALTGALDETYVEIAERMARRSPRVRPVIVPEAGHAVHAERPDTVASLVRRFLDDWLPVVG
jgi:2-succinyl-6-hydroxy-2,4-cyclohexadiene-1-carboxylate synthase